MYIGLLVVTSNLGEVDRGESVLSTDGVAS